MYSFHNNFLRCFLSFASLRNFFFAILLFNINKNNNNNNNKQVKSIKGIIWRPGNFFFRIIKFACFFPRVTHDCFTSFFFWFQFVSCLFCFLLSPCTTDLKKKFYDKFFSSIALRVNWLDARDHLLAMSCARVYFFCISFNIRRAYFGIAISGFMLFLLFFWKK